MAHYGLEVPVKFVKTPLVLLVLQLTTHPLDVVVAPVVLTSLLPAPGIPTFSLLKVPRPQKHISGLALRGRLQAPLLIRTTEHGFLVKLSPHPVVLLAMLLSKFPANILGILVQLIRVRLGVPLVPMLALSPPTTLRVVLLNPAVPIRTPGRLPPYPVITLPIKATFLELGRWRTQARPMILLELLLASVAPELYFVRFTYRVVKEVV